MFYKFLVFLSLCSVALSLDKRCKDIDTSEMKMNLVRDSLNQIKDLFTACRDTDDTNTCSKKSSALAHLNLVIDTLVDLELIGSDKKLCPKCPDPIIGGSTGPVDCQEILNSGNTKSGIYTIYPKDRLRGSKGLQVYCDMDTEGGGWTVIQRRGNYSTQTDFHQNWDTYKKGFGNLEREFWLGNDNIFTLTNQGVYTLRIDMRNANGDYKFSQHGVFFITDEKSEYVLYVQDSVGNAPKGLSNHHMNKFSTKDRQNDGRKDNDQCARVLHSGWWYYPPTYPNYYVCGLVNINGLYMPGVKSRNSNWWWNWTGYKGLLFSEMKIRHRNFESKKEE